MQTPWIPEKQLARALARNEAYWACELEEYPLLWITAPPAQTIAKPARDADLWLDTDYVTALAEDRLSRTHYVADALPIHHPWLGPNEVAAWLGGDLKFDVERNWTSWVDPWVEDWDEITELRIDPENKWWKIYMDQIRRSVEAGKDKWVTAFPDLHTGIDALMAMRGTDRLNMDLLINPEPIRRLMPQTTELFKFIVDAVGDCVIPAGQGTTNWTLGWSAARFVCIGQNDFSCMISPEMFREFLLEDTVATTNYVDHSMYHLDGTGSPRHLPILFEIERLDSIQWVPVPGNLSMRENVQVMRQIQAAGKATTINGASAAEIVELSRHLDPRSLMFRQEMSSPEEAEELFKQVRRACAERRPPIIATS